MYPSEEVPSGMAAAIPALFPGYDPDPEGVFEDPWPVLQAWSPDNSAPERPLMCLATLDENGAPDARHVLLSGLDQHGLYFHTSTATRKATQLAAHPQAVISIAWPEAGKQLVVQGVVSLTSRQEAEVSYRSRSDYLKTLAWANSPELALRPVKERRRAWAAVQLSDEAPPTWRGYVLEPTRVTFWRGDEAGPSRRTEYQRAGTTTWQRTHLPG